jgi:hypothetical protein
LIEFNVTIPACGSQRARSESKYRAGSEATFTGGGLLSIGLTIQHNGRSRYQREDHDEEGSKAGNRDKSLVKCAMQGRETRRELNFIGNMNQGKMEA